MKEKEFELILKLRDATTSDLITLLKSRALKSVASTHVPSTSKSSFVRVFSI